MQIFITKVKPYFRTANFFFIFHGLFRNVAISFFFSSTSSFSLANSSSVIGSSSESESELQIKVRIKTITKTQERKKFSVKSIHGVNFCKLWHLENAFSVAVKVLPTLYQRQNLHMKCRAKAEPALHPEQWNYRWRMTFPLV